jgi:hypothetical protein
MAPARLGVVKVDLLGALRGGCSIRDWPCFCSHNRVEVSMSRWPFLITFREKVYGNGFLAEVVAQGRALGVVEGEKDFWLYGVNPGALAAGGESGGDAHINFVRALRTVLYDFAGAATFEAFKAETERFFREANTETEKEWFEAVADVRAGKAAPTDVPQKPAETPMSVTVTLKDNTKTFTAADNVVDEPSRALAA